jgi:hypothetical protein
MAGQFVEVQPDGAGKKVEALNIPSDTDSVFRQVVTLPEGRDIQLADTEALILEELREMRRVLCEAFRINYENISEEKKS